MNGLLTPHRFSLESEISSRPRTTSSLSIDTATTGSTIRGLASHSSRLVYAVGDAIRQEIELWVIRKRISAARKVFPCKDEDAPDLAAVYEDVLELARWVIALRFACTSISGHCRPGIYPLLDSRQHALKILLTQIAMSQTTQLIKHLLHRPMIENSLLLAEIVLCLPINW